MKLICRLVLFALIFELAAHAQQAASLSATVRQYVRVAAQKVVLQHVRVVDGTGGPVLENRNITIEHGKITAVSEGAAVRSDADTTVLEYRGYTVIPGIIGMHDHLSYIARPNLRASGEFENPILGPEMAFSAPRLYLASGVTTIRTAGSVEPYADLNLKAAVDAGKLPGPHMDVTGPYLEGPDDIPAVQLHHLTGPDDAQRTVEYWASEGITSVKAYITITRAELKTAIDTAHAHGLKVAGHLCSVTFKEAAELGIDSLEHGFFTNTQLDPDKKPDQCSSSAGSYTVEHMDPNGPIAKDLIDTLIRHHVAVTSTLPIFEGNLPGRPPLRQAVLDAMSPEARQDYFYMRRTNQDESGVKQYKNDVAMERAFVKAGGLLMAGPDPTGDGGVVAGYGDQRAIELLVEAGFSAVEAIRIATLNGATYLGKQNQIGSILVGKNADLVIVKGDPSVHIEDIENVDIVFKDGVGYDPQKLIASVKGQYGRY